MALMARAARAARALHTVAHTAPPPNYAFYNETVHDLARKVPWR